ncbi:hypothetical protein F4779DRAFT_625068 [Xylariaceae sp. FL0662B]|nr:hypothetical protein F4779DRAFT_625068 [Xylariaceae sp. FL0662B]
MEMIKRKRAVSSCIPCYTKKQKCSRGYPCDHCSRRRQPELCAYYPSDAAQTPNRPTRANNRQNEETGSSEGQWEHGIDRRASSTSSTSATSPILAVDKASREKSQPSSLAEVFGYLEESKSNTLALVQRIGVHDEDRDLSVPIETVVEVQKALGVMPSRPTLDFLVQYFFAEVNWIDQLLYPPWFLVQYQKWWNLDQPSSVSDIEFPVLFLRICWYASQFLPSPGYTVDSIRGVALSDIRKSCNSVADVLEPICTRLDTRGSLLRVQHLAFSGLGCLCQGRINGFWGALGCSVWAAQRIGVHLDATLWANNLDGLEKEIQRRTFCSLYVVDSVLSRRFDSIPLLPSGLSPDYIPQMHLVPDLVDAVDAPDVFTGRVLQAQLADFWRKNNPITESEYDVLVVEERYEMFCSEFLATIPPVFSLQPNTQWDSRLPKLSLQRQVLHMAIFESLCYNFRPALLQDPDHVESLPGYKRILLSSHKKALAGAALKLLEGVSALHLMMGCSHTRFEGIIIPTFEAAVPLLCLCADSGFPGDTIEARYNRGPFERANVTRDHCMRAAHGALSRLQTLAEVSNVAEIGARTLTRLIGIVERSPTQTQTFRDSIGLIDPVQDYTDCGPQ